MYDYAMWGDGYDDLFWGYGYGDIYAGIFAPYGYDDLTGYLPQYASSNPGGPGQTAQTAPASVAASRSTRSADANVRRRQPRHRWPADRSIPTKPSSRPTNSAPRSTISPTPRSRRHKTSRPPARRDIALTAPNRLAAMQRRIEAMIAAVQTVQPPLEKFYGLLSDEQKARLTALGNDQRQSKANGETPRARPARAAAPRTGRDGMADRRDRPNGAPDRCATREPGRAAERHRPGGGFA